MNAAQAQTALKKLFGKSAAWRRDENAPIGDEREAIKETLAPLSTAYTDAKAARDARRAELLKDPEYVRLCAEAEAAQKAHGRALGRYHSHRVTVGYTNSAAGLSFFTIKGEGDNWQEAIDAARAKVGK